jgi:ribosomal protein S18 acetylase RimI-like enzyme
MSTVSLPLSSEKNGKIRAANPLRDLPRIADLVELCFHKNMDSEGKRYVNQMRDASKNRKYLQWVNTSMPLLGYVWEEDGQLIGNISIVPFTNRNFLLANIAVHPEYRRRGIGRALTLHAMQQVRDRGAKNIWLHVEEDNDGAIQLYRSLGFEDQALRSIWNASTGIAPRASKDPRITTKTARFWPQQKDWLNNSYPEDLRWYRMPDFQIFGPGIKNWLYRFFVESDLRQWVIQKDGKPQALLSWMSTHARRTQLWLATTPDADARSLAALLLHVRIQLLSRRTELYLDYPAGEHAEAFTEAGFSLQRILLWMRAPGKVQP